MSCATIRERIVFWPPMHGAPGERPGDWAGPAASCTRLLSDEELVALWRRHSWVPLLAFSPAQFARVVERLDEAGASEAVEQRLVSWSPHAAMRAADFLRDELYAAINLTARLISKDDDERRPLWRQHLEHLMRLAAELARPGFSLMPVEQLVESMVGERTRLLEEACEDAEATEERALLERSAEKLSLALAELGDPGLVGLSVHVQVDRIVYLEPCDAELLSSLTADRRWSSLWGTGALMKASSQEIEELRSWIETVRVVALETAAFVEDFADSSSAQRRRDLARLTTRGVGGEERRRHRTATLLRLALANRVAATQLGRRRAKAAGILARVGQEDTDALLGVLAVRPVFVPEHELRAEAPAELLASHQARVRRAAQLCIDMASHAVPWKSLRKPAAVLVRELADPPGPES